MSRTLDGEELILSLDVGEYFGLDGVGTFIWSLLREPVAVSEIVTAVSSEYAVESERAQSDITELLRKLLQKELIETV